MKISDRLSQIQGSATAQIFSQAKELEESGKDIVHLEIGQPDFGPPEAVIDATIDALKSNKTSYTVSKGIEELREKISEFHVEENGIKVDHKNEVVITAGAKLGIFGSLWSVTNTGDNVIILNPSWVSYNDIVISLGAEPRYIGVDMDFSFNETKMNELIDDRTKAMIVNSPSNPTGGLISEDNLKKLISLCRENDILLISDEIYSEYIYEGEHYSLLNQPNWKEIGVVVTGFSKTFSMTGYRLGYVLGRTEIISQVNKVMQLTASCGVNFAQHAAIVALEEISSMRAFIKETMFERRKLVVELLNEIGIEFNPPKGSIYAWFKIPSNDSVEWCSQLLKEQGVALTPGRAFGPDGEGYARICFATNLERLREGITRIGKFIEN